MDERAEAPEQIGNYRITGELGRGGMGVVFRGEHLSLGRPAAIKVLPPQLADQEEFVARFLREARAAARLDHPNLVRVYDAGKTNGSYYIAMELVPGHTLAQELSQKGPLPVHRALEVARAVALALTEAARHDIIHRDVKPANILIRDDGVVKLADLGLAKAVGSAEVTLSQTPLGTPLYMAPEQARDARSVDTRADLYSLGCTLYYMLTGAVPFTGTSHFSVMKAHETEPVPDPRQVRIDLPKPIAQLTRWMMAKRPEDRPQSPQEVVTCIDRFFLGLVEPTAPEPLPSRVLAPAAAGKPAGLRALREPLVLVPLLLLVGMLAVGLLLWSQGRTSRVPAKAPAGTSPSAAVPASRQASPSTAVEGQAEPSASTAPQPPTAPPPTAGSREELPRQRERLPLTPGGLRGQGLGQQGRRLRSDLPSAPQAVRQAALSNPPAAYWSYWLEFYRAFADGDHSKALLVARRSAFDPELKELVAYDLEDLEAVERCYTDAEQGARQLVGSQLMVHGAQAELLSVSEQELEFGLPGAERSLRIPLADLPHDELLTYAYGSDTELGDPQRLRAAFLLYLAEDDLSRARQVLVKLSEASRPLFQFYDRKLTLATTGISVTSWGPPLLITLDGEPVGETPATVMSLSPGPHTVVASSPPAGGSATDPQPYSQTKQVTLDEGKVAEVRFAPGETGRALLPTPRRPSPSASGKLYERVSCDWNNVPLRYALSDLSQKTGVNIRLDSKLRYSQTGVRVTYEAEDVLAISALRYVTSQAGLTYLVEDGGVLVTSVPDTTRPPRRRSGSRKIPVVRRQTR